MAHLELRQEFQGRHMRGTAIELSNRQNTGWAQSQNASAILEITYPSSDVRRALEAVSTSSSGKSVVMIGQRGSGKSHIMALIHYAFESPDAVEQWASSWGNRLGLPNLAEIKLQRGFKAISETLSNAEFPVLWDVLFERHPRGAYYRGRFEQSGSLVPSKSLIQDMFGEQKTALILDELQTWYDGLHNEPGPEGRKHLQWAFNFIQILSEIAEDRPDLFSLIVSVRDNTTDAFQQIHRKSPVVIDFKGETAREDRKRLVLHRLFKNRSNIPSATIEQTVSVYAKERNRLLFPERSPADQTILAQECVECWPYSPELLSLLEDQILMAAAAQDSRDFIRMLAEVFRARGASSPIITPADFSIDDDECGVTTLIDSFATSADQERLREKAIRNLSALKEANVPAPHMREVISSIWVRSLSAVQAGGATRREVQLDLTSTIPVDDNAFTAELAEIVENSFNIHESGLHEKRYCFRLPENPESKLKAWARNDRAFDPQTAAAPGLMRIGRDQEFLCKFLNHYLKTPDLARELPSQVVVLDVNWENAPWANIQQQDQPASWTEKGKPVLIVLPCSPQDNSGVLGPWLVNHVPQNRNMVRFLLPKADQLNIYTDRSIVITARCALLAREWQQAEPQYRDLQKKFETALSNDLKTRFDRYAILATWNFQTPSACTFHCDFHGATGADISAAVENHVRNNQFAPEDFEKLTLEAAGRGDTMRQLLAQLREPPLPGELAIPYLGDLPIFESVLRIVAKGKLAVNAGGRWYGREPDESTDAADIRLRQRLGAFTGQAMLAVQLGDVSQVGGGGVAVPPAPIPPVPQPFPPVSPQPFPGGGTPPSSPLPPQPLPGAPTPIPSPVPLPAPPVVRRSMGAKTGINLLADLEKWALPDSQKAAQASLTFNGLTVKELRDLCVKLPPKLQAELQVTLPPENGNGS
jgi:energy-coupling factor transporter ATP-binding protein EcfA2